MGSVQTWTLLVTGLAPAANKVMAGLHNGSAARNLRIRRIGLINAQILGATGVACLIDVRRYYNSVSWGSSPTSVTPIAHDTDNTALSSVTAGYGGAASGGSGPDVFRRLYWNTAPSATSYGAANSVTLDDWEVQVPLGLIFDPGYADVNEQPLCIRNGEMVFVWNTPNVTTGLLDTWIEFTNEAA